MHSKYGTRRKNKPSQQPINEEVPRPLEVVRDKLRAYIDKYATIKDNTVEYSFYDHKTRVATKRVLSLAECTRITEELYNE